MKVFIYLFIMVLSFIIISHLLTTVKEGFFQCVTPAEAAQFNSNKNLIQQYQKQLQDFDAYVAGLEKQVTANAKQIVTNQKVNRGSKLAVCPAGKSADIHDWSDGCPGTHILGTISNAQQTEICKCNCCDFVDSASGNYCTNPFGTTSPSPSDKKAEENTVSGIPDDESRGTGAGQFKGADPIFAGQTATGTGGTQQAAASPSAKKW